MASERKRSSSGAAYQVFLSFRGPDTRQGFADVLYHALKDQGICVFQDDEEIRKGEDIHDEILRAIQDSRIFVPIFSRNYASSKWCLKELAMMFESMQASNNNNGKRILPIFYDVRVGDVKLKTEMYKGALSEHRQTSDPEIVQQWEKALQRAGKIKGSKLRNKGYAEFSKSFAREVSLMLKVKHKSVAEFFLPGNYQEDELLNLLEIETSGVRFVGIHGMGGIGKTTLAKVVYNKLCYGFPHSCFLSDIRESCRQYKGIEHLQNRLLADLGLRSENITDVIDGTKRIIQLVAEKKVLVVLDDVDHEKQIQSLAGKGWFGSGSRIIITSRNKDVLKNPGVDILEVKKMKHEDALRLFSMHAFDNDSPPADYLSISDKAVATTGGLPLALEVIGSHLRKKSRKHWEIAIQRLEKVPHQDVQEKLMISYEVLDSSTKQIFLDISCFFINCDKTNPTYLWEAGGFDPHDGVEKLVNLSLIKIIKEKGASGEIKKVLWMHDQLRDLGRTIAAKENFKDIIKQRRLWMPDDAFTALSDLEDEKDHRGNIEMMRLPYEFDSQRCTFTTGEISSFKNLRYLECSGANFSGDQRLLLPKLLWLSWRHCPRDFTGTDLHFRNLVILDLSFSSISETWRGWRHIRIENKLKVLDLSGCKSLTKTPDLSQFLSLERLILKDCINMTDLDPSICKLQGLKLLNVRGCDSLKGFPEELCSLDSLKVILGVGGNERWGRCFNMPERFGHIRSLSILTFYGVKLEKLPESMRMLVGLRCLSLSGCQGLQGLPDLLGDMLSLAELDLSWTDIFALPQEIGRLEKLELLKLNGCSKLKMLPNSIGHLRSLVELFISYSGITQLPETIGNLQELRVMRLNGIGIKKLPRSIGMLKSLEELHAGGCKSLVEIPSTINELPHLSILDLRETRITRLPPKLPNTLTKLHVSSPNLPKLCNVVKFVMGNEVYDGNFGQLKSSKLKGIGKCRRLVELELKLNISSVPKGLSSLSQLQRLTLRCSKLKSCPLLPPCLSTLVLLGLSHRAKPPQLSSLKNLSELKFEECSAKDGAIFGNMGIKELESLTVIRFKNCYFRNLNLFFLPECLLKLHVYDCRFLETVYGLTHLKRLKHLEFRGCKKLVKIPSKVLRELDSLESLIWDWPSHKRIPVRGGARKFCHGGPFFLFLLLVVVLSLAIMK